jgi:cytochrome c556
VAVLSCVAIGDVPRAGAQDKKPYPVFTAQQFTAAMKTVGQAWTAANGAVGSGQTEDAKAYVAITRDRLATTVTFWRDRKRGDAAGTLRQTLALLDRLDGALSVEPVNAAAVAGLAREVDDSCRACHQTYREQDPATRAFRFRGVEN